MRLLLKWGGGRGLRIYINLFSFIQTKRPLKNFHVTEYPDLQHSKKDIFYLREFVTIKDL